MDNATKTEVNTDLIGKYVTMTQRGSSRSTLRYNSTNWRVETVTYKIPSGRVGRVVLRGVEDRTEKRCLLPSEAARQAFWVLAPTLLDAP